MTRRPHWNNQVSGEPTTPAPAVNVDDLLAQADKAFADADAALRAGDLAGYQTKIQEGVELIRRARDRSAAGTASTTTTTAPTA